MGRPLHFLIFNSNDIYFIIWTAFFLSFLNPNWIYPGKTATTALTKKSCIKKEEQEGGIASKIMTLVVMKVPNHLYFPAHFRSLKYFRRWAFFFFIIINFAAARRTSLVKPQTGTSSVTVSSSLKAAVSLSVQHGAKRYDADLQEPPSSRLQQANLHPGLRPQLHLDCQRIPAAEWDSKSEKSNRNYILQ